MDDQKRQFVYDVIISGAGPVGLLLASELALAACSVLILEKAETPSSPLKRMPFGIRGLSAPSVETLYRRGLLKELEIHKRMKNPHQHAVQGANRQAGHFAGIPFYDGNIDTSQWRYRLPSSTDASLISELDELETVLTRRAASLGVDIKRGCATTDFQQTEVGVTVHAGAQTFDGKWLVGCDGARSAVRKVGGFDFAGTEPEFTGYTTLVDIADPDKLKPGRNVTAAGMYMQSQPGYVVIQDFDGGAFHRAEKTVTLEHLQAVLRRVSNTDVRLNALHLATTWTDRARQATTYRKGRVFLAGDAAHIHSPLGGQGLNLGLGDAINLGWKLAAAVHGKAPVGLLDSYEAERHPIGSQVLDWSRAQVAVMQPTPAGRALNAVLRDLMNTRDGATYFAGRVWGIFSQYKLAGQHPLVGHSVPNFEFEDGVTIGEKMSDGRGILLVFDGSNSLQAWVGESSDRVKYVSGKAKIQLGLSATLIRPDGVVAWAADGQGDAQSFRQAAGHWFS